MMPWIARWKCFEKCFGTCLPEILSLILLLFVLAPCIAILVWTFMTFTTYEFTYDGSEEPSLAGHYDNCKTASAAIFFMMGAFETMRIGIFQWRFRQWLIAGTTFGIIGVSVLLFLMYVFMLTQTVDENDDIMNATVFMVLSGLPIVRILYNYYDDISIDLNDYLYGSVDGTQTQMLAKGSRWSSWENRWNFLRYFLHVCAAFAMYIAYGLAGLWINTRSSSPGYVLPYIIIVDGFLLTLLHSATGKDFLEVIFTFGTLLISRVIVLYLAFQDRNSAKPGAYEFVEPVFFLLIMVIICKRLADQYWFIQTNNPEHIVASDRYNEWM
jgi:hypothetical protein